MNKIGLRKVVYDNLKKKYPKITHPEVKDIIESVLESIVDALISTKKVSLRKLGIFDITYLNERKGYNPIIKKYIRIPPRAKVRFKTANTLKENLKLE